MLNQQYTRLKRAFDLVAGTLALLIFSPIMLMAVAAIRLESPGPVIYRSRRIGQHYKVFDLLKFRTMHQHADQQKELLRSRNQYSTSAKQNKLAMPVECQFCKILQRPCSPLLYGDGMQMCENLFLIRKERSRDAIFHKIQGDPRVTWVGSFLRKSSIDELPQLINVLKGDMSLIGNRPLPLYEAEKLTTDYAIERFNVPAGLTGLWQVRNRGKVRVSEKSRIELDLEYSRNMGFRTDASILLKTLPALIQESDV